MAEGNGKLDESAIADFRLGIRGGVIAPGDADYDTARALNNGMIDKRPAVIARCVDVGDVITALRFGHEQGLDVAVRGGGHNGAGLASVDGGLMVDLSGIRGVRVDPDARTAQAGGGCQLGDLDHAAHAFGLATPAGILSTTGAGGLTLGGGHGYLSRKYGLTIDNLVGADVVLADGTFVKASESENADLFWALRGGGGNFGVVTQFTYRLHPVDTVIAGITFWPIEQAPEVLRWYREFEPAQPDDVYGFFAVATVPPAPPFPEDIHLRKVCGVVWCITDPALQDDALGAAQAVGSPIFHFAAPMPYPALQSLFDGLYPPGLQWYWRGDFFGQISDEAIETHLEFGSNLPTMHSTMHLYPIDGAVHRVGSGDTAWSFRDALWSGVFGGVDPDPANAGVIRDWAVGYQEALHKSSMGGAYVNFMMEEGQERVQATYRDNYPRLVEVKKQYDPDNFFHVNQNIKPTG
ncbi:MAG TPA: FAD-binding oxidoreductase [Actinomycetota bacterium]|nr:FAD-binding oxidoreductase [Actinomycetota bacterium]